MKKIVEAYERFYFLLYNEDIDIVKKDFLETLKRIIVEGDFIVDESNTDDVSVDNTITNSSPPTGNIYKIIEEKASDYVKKFSNPNLKTNEVLESSVWNFKKLLNSQSVNYKFITYSKLLATSLFNGEFSCFYFCVNCF